MSAESLIDRLRSARNFYNSGITKSYAFRRTQLLNLKAAIVQQQKQLHEALYADLKKSPEESWITETGFVLSEISSALKNLRRWMAPETVRTNLLNFPSSSYIQKEPLGVVLIISPWNYPFQLLFAPLVGAVAAGNCVVLKSSEFAPATSSVMKRIIEENFPAELIVFSEGDGASVVPGMINQFRFNHIFYTGSTQVGRMIYKMAADKLVPVTLELGGKSPCVVDSDANIKVAARRIALTKFSNAGQMCVAPDYVLVHRSVKDIFLAEIKKAVTDFFSTEPSTDYGYCKIINQKQFNRVIGYLTNGTVVHGGRYDPATLFIEPTIIEDVSLDMPLMREEIFGPLLPVIPFGSFDEAKTIIEKNPDPLAFYVYTSSRKKEKYWLEQIPAGGSCVNNSSWHLTNHYLPFGGRGSSGSGDYHGKYSFDTFTHRRAVMRTPSWFDPAVRYPPYKGKLWLFKKILR